MKLKHPSVAKEGNYVPLIEICIAHFISLNILTPCIFMTYDQALHTPTALVFGL